MSSDPRVQAYQAQEAFKERVRKFIANPEALALVRRSEEFEQLRREIDAREKSREMMASEAMLLEVLLINAVTTDEIERADRTEKVAEKYRRRSEQVEREWAARRRPQFDAYKSEEARIVKEVRSLQQVPSGLTREEYLRKRLQQAREKAYSATQ